MCGEGQSFRKVYGASHKAADLRPLVQDFNLKFGKEREREEVSVASGWGDEEEEGGDDGEGWGDEIEPVVRKPSKWDHFLPQVFLSNLFFPLLSFFHHQIPLFKRRKTQLSRPRD